MRILVSTGPSYGLYCPVVPMAWALRAAGHEVLVAAPEGLAPTANGSGLPFMPTYGPMHMAEVMAHDRAGNPIVFAREEPQMLEQAGRGFGRLAARNLPGLRKVVEQWRPDVIIGEPHSYSAAIAAQLHGIPWVEHGVGLGYFREMDKHGVAELEPELTELGLGGLPEPDLALEPCPSSLLPESGARGHAMRYVQYDPPATVPSWAFDRHERPRLLLTLGTVAPAAGGARVLRELVNLLPRLGVELLVAVANDIVPELGPLPDAVVAAGFLPLASVLPSCDLVVHHCGGGSTMAAILAGLPQLLVPQPIVAEQYDSARRVTAYGSARQLVGQPIDPDAVMENVRALLEDETYRTKARALRAEVSAMPSPASLVPLIEELAADAR
ncbi:nucleotide disphospho-sugar-binding domain-containing protein [Streptacidiphilus sp. MAP12-33]|uniref:nucleotide disphospho-sugar-binding domain-containing protein n=1 Tax=Streptacidiphilus sp. MAP12-33 TaxID=3156266 RepID=UPI0035167AB6